MPEVAPGGNGTGFCGGYRVAAAGRGAALSVRRAAGAVGSCPAALGRDGEGDAGVLAAAVAGAGRAGGRTVLLPLDPSWSRAAFYGAAVIMTVLVLAARAGGGAAARPFAAGAGGDPPAGPGVDGEVVAGDVAVLLACGGPAGAAGEAAPAGVGEGGRPAGGAVGIEKAGDCLAALEAVTAGIAGRFPALAAVSGARGGRAPVAGACGWRRRRRPLGFSTTLLKHGRRVAFVIVPGRRMVGISGHEPGIPHREAAHDGSGPGGARPAGSARRRSRCGGGRSSTTAMDPAPERRGERGQVVPDLASRERQGPDGRKLVSVSRRTLGTGWAVARARRRVRGAGALPAAVRAACRRRGRGPGGRPEDGEPAAHRGAGPAGSWRPGSAGRRPRRSGRSSGGSPPAS